MAYVWVFKRHPAVNGRTRFVDVPALIADELVRDGAAVRVYDQRYEIRDEDVTPAPPPPTEPEPEPDPDPEPEPPEPEPEPEPPEEPEETTPAAPAARRGPGRPRKAS